MGIAMGIGRIGNPQAILKRKFRWTLAIATPVGVIPYWYVKLAARPKLSVDSTEINFLNQTTWVPGKVKWEPITVQYNDVPDVTMAPLWSWIASIYNFNNVNLPMSEKAGWAGTANLIAYDGCGTILEQWFLYSVYPETVDFGDVDYKDSELMSIELQLRYSEVNYIGSCGPTPTGICTGC